MNTATKRGMSETKMTLLGKREKVFTQAGTDQPNTRTTLGYNPQKYLTKTLFEQDAVRSHQSLRGVCEVGIFLV